MSSVEAMRVGQCEETTKSTQVREWHYVVTLEGICGDPHYTSFTYPGKLFMKIESECSCWLQWGMRWGEIGLIEVFRGPWV